MNADNPRIRERPATGNGGMAQPRLAWTVFAAEKEPRKSVPTDPGLRPQGHRVLRLFRRIPTGTSYRQLPHADAVAATVVPFSHFRRSGKPGYEITFIRARENFPSWRRTLIDAQPAANQTIEQKKTRTGPVLWMHRRFKTDLIQMTQASIGENVTLLPVIW